MSKKEQLVKEIENGHELDANAGLLMKNLKKVSIAVGAIVAVIVIVVLVNQYYIAPRNEKAATEIASAQMLFLSGEYEKALNGDGVNLGFLQVIEQYGSTPSGNIARLYAGLCYAHTEKAAEAIKYLEDYDDCGDMMVSNAAIAALGNCYAHVGETEKAANTLVKAAKQASNVTQSPLFYIQAGELFESLGKNAEALQCYETVKKEYSQSFLSEDIDKYIERVK
jgi:tetratricopeptide (TPR) repeat protein